MQGDGVQVVGAGYKQAMILVHGLDDGHRGRHHGGHGLRRGIEQDPGLVPVRADRDALTDEPGRVRRVRRL